MRKPSPGDRDGVVSVEEVFFSKAFGFCPEFFEKSIDKHKIDAILNSTVRRSGREAVMGLAEFPRLWMRGRPNRYTADSDPGLYVLTGLYDGGWWSFSLVLGR